MNDIASSCNHKPSLPGTCQLLDVSDVSIHLVSQGTGPLVLFVHGSQAWAYAWRHQMMSFVERIER